jgi:hypothetical protein
MEASGVMAVSLAVGTPIRLMDRLKHVSCR